MPTRGEKTSEKTRARSGEPPVLPDDFPDELRGDFAEVPEQFWANFGTVCGLALTRGGYVGLSITDDAGSAKLAIRCPSVTFEKRVYKFGDLQKLLNYARGKL